MRVYRFEEEDTGRFALTADQGGARLPLAGAVWRLAGAVEAERVVVAGVAVAPLAIKEAILAKGYFLWPDDAGTGAGAGVA